MARIGVEETLTDVQQLLREHGHDVVVLKREQDMNGCDCCVISGQDQNMMNMQNAEFQGSVINAHGFNSEEICDEVEEKLQLH
ncbi:YkuS family protein [Alteribacillus sp. HJP-4]|uniref:YkuS family protein n=1 Tax=Alteribacillus sp. HJP-4 TaxID=2775394 RepID=UPI0035CD0B80